MLRVLFTCGLLALLSAPVFSEQGTAPQETNPASNAATAASTSETEASALWEKIDKMLQSLRRLRNIPEASGGVQQRVKEILPLYTQLKFNYADSAATKLAIAAPGKEGLKATAKADKPPARTGDFEGDILNPKDGRVLSHYRARVPENLPKDHHFGLILMVDDYWTDPSLSKDPTLRVIAESLKRINRLEEYILLDLPPIQGNNTVLASINWMLETYPIDRRRVFIIGWYIGGRSAIQFAGAHEDLIAGAALFEAFNGLNRIGHPRPDGLQMYFVFQDKPDDPHVHPYLVWKRASRNSLTRAGSHIIYRETDFWAGMRDPRLQPLIDECMSWFHQLRNEQQPLTQEHAAFLLGFKDQKKFDDLWTNPDAIAKIVAIGGRPAEDLIVRALHSKNESVQRNAAVAAQQCISSRAGVENTLLRDPAVTALEHKGLTELNKRVLDKPTSTAVRTAAIAAIGNAARWNCGYAQKLLADLAKGKKLDPSDRVLAVSALAEPLPCITMAKVYDDDIILPTLAELLDDDAAPVRRAAFAALSKVKADGFGYNPEADGKARKDAVKQWREWATAKASFYAKQPKP